LEQNTPDGRNLWGDRLEVHAINSRLFGNERTVGQDSVGGPQPRWSGDGLNYLLRPAIGDILHDGTVEVGGRGRVAQTKKATEGIVRSLEGFGM
jgi:hypothetical protein